MAKTPRSKKAKGTRLEKEIAKRIEYVLGEYGVRATRTPMSGAIDRFKSDIFTNLDVGIEVKNQERLNFREAWRQAKADAGSKIPILATSRNNDPEILCLLDFEDLLFFMEMAVRQGWSNVRKTKKNDDKEEEN